MPKISKRSATARQIGSITGLEDDGFITAILSLGPTTNDVELAIQCLKDDGLRASHSVNSIVQRVCEILEAHNDLDELGERL